jgi:hypothetical protein
MESLRNQTKVTKLGSDWPRDKAVDVLILSLAYQLSSKTISNKISNKLKRKV